MKFSILIPVYNTEKYLKNCIDSIKNQLYTNFEAIIVDDGSSNDCALLCDELVKDDNRFKVVHQKNAGLYMARCVAKKYASGDYIVFVDSDDSVDISFLKTLEKIIKKKEYDMIIFNANIINEKNDVIGSRIIDKENGEIISKEEIIKNIIVNDKYNPVWIKCIKNCLYNPSDRFVNINMAEDVLNTTQMIRESDTIYFCNDKLYNYRINEGSITHNIKIEHLYQSTVSRGELYDLALDIFGLNSKYLMIMKKNYIKSLCWYISQIGYKEFKKNYDIINEIKKSKMYIKCIEEHKMSIIYKCMLFLFEKGKYFSIYIITKLKFRGE